MGLQRHVDCIMCYLDTIAKKLTSVSWVPFLLQVIINYVKGSHVHNASRKKTLCLVLCEWGEAPRTAWTPLSARVQVAFSPGIPIGQIDHWNPLGHPPSPQEVFVIYSVVAELRGENELLSFRDVVEVCPNKRLLQLAVRNVSQVNTTTVVSKTSCISGSTHADIDAGSAHGASDIT